MTNVISAVAAGRQRHYVLLGHKTELMFCTSITKLPTYDTDCSVDSSRI